MVEGFKSLSVKKDLFDYAKSIFDELPSNGDSFSNWIGKKIELSIKKELWLKKYAKHLSFRRIIDNQLELLDDHESKIIRVSYKDNRLWCDSCHTKNCMHCYYSMGLLELANLNDFEK